MDADPDLLTEIRELRGMSVEEVAEACQVDRSTVERWESGDTRPYLRNRDALARAFGVSLGLLVRAVWGRTQEERGMYRRHLLRMVMGLPVLALPDLAGMYDFDLHERTARLIARYPATAPAELLIAARIHLDVLTTALEGPLMRGQRRHMLADAMHTASLAANATKMDRRPGEASAYRLLARKIADESGIDRLRGCALMHSAVALSPIWEGGDSLAALELLNAAAPLIGSRGLVAAELAMCQAENHAALGRERDALAAVARAEAAGDGDDGDGFFSSVGWFAGDDDPRVIAGWQGFCHLLLKRTDEGLGLLDHALSVPHINARAAAEWHSNITLGHIIAGDPEPACHAADQALDVSEATGYRAGVQRIFTVRGRMPEEWSATQCVRNLDQRLRLAA